MELSFFDTGIRVATAESGAEALDKIASLTPDLVIADVVMGEPSGYDVCRAVKASDHPVPVLLLAGTFEPFEPDRARECGADGCLVKPFDSRTLIAHVTRLLAVSQQPSSATVEAVGDAQDSTSAEDELENVLDDLAAIQHADRLAAASDGPPDAEVGAWEPEAPPESSGVETERLTAGEGLAAGEEPPYAPEPSGPSYRPPVVVGDGDREQGDLLEPLDARDLPLTVDSGRPAPHPPGPGSTPSAPPPEAMAPSLRHDEIEAIVRTVMTRLSDQVLREIAWEVVPDLAERIIRERIRAIEAEQDEVS